MRIRERYPVDEADLHSQDDFYIEIADPVGIGTDSQPKLIPSFREGPCKTIFRGDNLFDPSRIEPDLLDRYLNDIRVIWPSSFDFREEIALQFLHECLHYRVKGLTPQQISVIQERLTTFLNDLRTFNRSHATLSVFDVSHDKKCKTVVAPEQSHYEKKFMSLASSRCRDAREKL